MADHFSARLQRFQRTLSSQQAILLSTSSDITYLTGFEFLVPAEREGFLVVTAKSVTLIKGHFCLFTPLKKMDVKVLNGTRPAQLAEYIQTILVTENINNVLIDESSLFVYEWKAVVAMANAVSPAETGTPITLGTFDREKLWEMRLIKDESEILLLRRAATIIADVMSQMPTFFRTGVTEKELADQLEALLRKANAHSPAFPTIVAFGANGAEPHYQPGDVPLKENTSILIDAGANYQGYCSDMTRTWWFGEEPSEEFAKAETAVKTAYQKACDILTQRTAPLIAKKVDNAARTSLTQAGYGDYFIHTTGHGVGLEIHEPPSLSIHNDTPLHTDMVITIEPGVYFPNQFGYRHENTVLITANGYEELTIASSE